MLAIFLVKLDLSAPTPQYILIVELALNLRGHLLPLAIVVLHEAADLRVGRTRGLLLNLVPWGWLI